jgi:dolichol-phosphate mannosyltransferase
MKQSQIKSIISIILPAYNEETILQTNIEKLVTFIENQQQYKWELLIIDDGSKDNTGKIADELAEKFSVIKVIHHIINQNLGTAIRTGFRHAKGDYIITLDIDLTYSVDHITKMLDILIETDSDIVLASPYMKNGKVTAVPFSRRVLSKYANRFMNWVAMEKHHTFTCMVRAYKGEFIRNLNLKSKTVAINTEIIYKADILRAQIIEIPAHLDWSGQTKTTGRVSSMKIYRSILLNLMAGFILRPYIFFLSIAGVLSVFFLYMFSWILINSYRIYKTLPTGSYFDDRFSNSLAQLYHSKPHSFLIAGFLFVVILQIFSTGFISLQKKRYFEELFHLGTSILKKNN